MNDINDIGVIVVLGYFSLKSLLVETTFSVMVGFYVFYACYISC